MVRPEAYLVDYDQEAYRELKNQGLNPETVLKPRLEKQIPTYLGEFILKVRFTEFSYDEVINPQTGQKELHAQGFVGEIGNSYYRAIREAKARGWRGAREEAEYEGFKELENQLFQVPPGTFYLWISPPGSKEEGYGKYSFTHLGQIQKTDSGRKIAITSVRNVLTLEDHAKIINYFLPEEKRLDNPKDTDFLRNPVVIANDGNFSIHDLLVKLDVILKRESGHTPHLARAYREKEDWEDGLREVVKPMIADYYSLIEKGASRKQLQGTIWSMENYIRVNKIDTPLVSEGPVPVTQLEKTVFYAKWSYAPPALSDGPCPLVPPSSLGSSIFSSAVLPWQEHKLENTLSSENKKTLECTCPNCQKKVKAVIEEGKIHCPACGASAPYEC